MPKDWDQGPRLDMCGFLLPLHCPCTVHRSSDLNILWPGNEYDVCPLAVQAGWLQLVVSNVPSTARDVKLCFYTVTTENGTPDRRVAVHYTTAAPHRTRSSCVL